MPETVLAHKVNITDSILTSILSIEVCGRNAACAEGYTAYLKNNCNQGFFVYQMKVTDLFLTKVISQLDEEAQRAVFIRFVCSA